MPRRFIERISRRNAHSQQYYDGFDYPENAEPYLISGFLAPAYLLYSAGIDVIPSPFWAVYTSPLTGKTTIVSHDSLSNQNVFGVDSGQVMRHEFGAYVKFEFNKEVWENVTINTKLDLFSNYLENPQNIDMNFNMLIAMKVNKYLTVNVSTEFIYDHDIKILTDFETGHKGPRLQVKELLGVGLAFNF